MIQFWHFFFTPVGQPWYTGGVWGNQLQWTIVWLPTLIVIYRKRFECKEKGCWRYGHYKVGNTHYKTCTKHTNPDIHAKLLAHHKRKYPKAHAFLHKAK